MKKINVGLILVFMSLVSFQQEGLEPLGQNPTLVRENAKVQLSRSINQNYIYAIDTIHMPFKDDFSKDFFKKFKAKSTDANVTDSVFYVIYNTILPDSLNAKYMLDTTHRYEVTIINPDSVSIDTLNLPSLGFVTICDLNNYPVTCVSKEIWPAYNEIDTIGTTPNPDNTYSISSPDVEQDSAQVYFVAATDTLSLWQNNFAYRNNDYAINPPTIGIVTFDGLNENGYPYDFSTAGTYGEADKLTSKPLFLDKRPNGTPYSLADSIYLSFYFQAQGIGNIPEIEDSIILQFWSPSDNAWNSVWKEDGQALDSNFKQVMVKIEDVKYLKAGFKFRFMNYSTLSGSFDHWNIDYVYLNSSRFAVDTNRDDVAFQYPIHTLLKDYTSMPWKHFKWNAAASMLDSVVSRQRNNNKNGRLVGNNDLEIFYKGNSQQIVANASVPSINGNSNFTTTFDLASVPYKYNVLVNDTNATFNIEIRHRTTPDFCRFNDTLRFSQELSDYYSLDDGTAEAAYGVQGLGGINPMISSQFELFQADTMKSVFVHFTPSANNMSGTNFYFTIWDDNGGEPGNIIHENTTLDVPRYNVGVNGFWEYALDNKVNIPAGKYYVGWQQTTGDRINIGYDKNINNRTRTYYNSNGAWSISGYKGSLMIRPSFVYQRDYSVAIKEVANENLSVFPNPASDVINIITESNINDYKMILMDVSGKIILNIKAEKQLNISELSEGIYILKVTNELTNNVMISRIVKK